jgi:hypothetical protein
MPPILEVHEPVKKFAELTAVKFLPTSRAMQDRLDLVLRGQGLNAVLAGFAAGFFLHR